jgi:hypothetical protein
MIGSLWNPRKAGSKEAQERVKEWKEFGARSLLKDRAIHQSRWTESTKVDPTEL